MKEGGGNGESVFEMKLKLWSWRFIVIIAIWSMGQLWYNLNAEVKDQKLNIEAQRVEHSKLEKEFREGKAADDEFKKNTERQLERIERKLDKVLP